MIRDLQVGRSRIRSLGVGETCTGVGWVWPGDGVVGVAVDSPAGMVFGEVGPEAEAVKVVGGGESRVGPGLDVVKMPYPGATHRHPAVPVAAGDGVPQTAGGGVDGGVGVEDGPGVGVAQQPGHGGVCGGDQVAGCAGGDRAVPVEVRVGGVQSEQGAQRDHDLDLHRCGRRPVRSRRLSCARISLPVSRRQHRSGAW